MCPEYGVTYVSGRTSRYGLSVTSSERGSEQFTRDLFASDAHSRGFLGKLNTTRIQAREHPVTNRRVIRSRTSRRKRCRFWWCERVNNSERSKSENAPPRVRQLQF